MVLLHCSLWMANLVTLASCYSTGSQRLHCYCLLVNKVENIDHEQVWAFSCICPQKYSFPWLIWAPFNVWFIGLCESTPEMASQSLVFTAIFAGLTLMTNRQTDRPCYLCNNWPHLMLYIVMWPSDGLWLTCILAVSFFVRRQCYKFFTFLFVMWQGLLLQYILHME